MPASSQPHPSQPASAAARAPSGAPVREREAMDQAMLALVGAYLGLELAPRQFSLDGGTRVEIDGADADLTVFVQLVTGSGNVKSTQRNKAMAEMLKMIWLRSSRFIATRMIVCVSEPSARFFQSPAWLGVAARELRIEVLTVREGRVVPVEAAA